VGADFGVIYDTNYGLKWTNMPSFNHRLAWKGGRAGRMSPLTRRGNYKAAEVPAGVPEWALSMCDIN